MSLRLEPLQPGTAARDNLSDVESAQLSLKLKDDNRCCRCCGITRKLGLMKYWFIQVIVIFLNFCIYMRDPVSQTSRKVGKNDFEMYAKT